MDPGNWLTDVYCLISAASRPAVDVLSASDGNNEVVALIWLRSDQGLTNGFSKLYSALLAVSVIVLL